MASYQTRTSSEGMTSQQLTAARQQGFAGESQGRKAQAPGERPAEQTARPPAELASTELATAELDARPGPASGSPGGPDSVAMANPAWSGLVVDGLISECENAFMEKCRNFRVGEAVWVVVKQRALDERVTVREVVERAVYAYTGLRGSDASGQRQGSGVRVAGAGRELTYAAAGDE